MSDKTEKSFEEFQQIIEELYNEDEQTRQEKHQKEIERILEKFDKPTNNIIQFDKNNSINKSVNNTKLKKKNLKFSERKIAKNILIIILTSIICLSITYGVAKITPKIITHHQTEQVKEECIDELYEELKDLGIEHKKLTPEGMINKSNPEYLKEHLLEFYLIIEEKYKLLEKDKVLNYLTQYTGLGETFDQYLISEGYFKKEYYSDITDNYYIKADRRAWVNAMEAIKLAEKNSQNKGIGKVH